MPSSKAPKEGSKSTFGSLKGQIKQTNETVGGIGPKIVDSGPYPWQSGLFYREPFKSLYILYIASTTYLIFLPYWLIVYSPRKARPRPSWSLKQTVLVKSQFRLQRILRRTKWAAFARNPFVEVDAASLKGQARFEWVTPAGKELIKGVASDEFIAPVKIPVYVYPKDGATDGDGLVALTFHGGGYFVFSGHPDCEASDIPKALVKIPVISSVFALDYRLSSHSPFPAQLIDAISAYAYLIEHKKVEPKRIVIVGDSAGGNLALALARYLRDEKVLPNPGGMLLCSPWCDAAWDLPHRPKDLRLTNEGVCYLNKAVTSELYHAALAGRRNPEDILPFFQSPYLSPAWKGLDPTPELFEGFPKTYLCYGKAEALVDEIWRLEERLKVAGVDLTVLGVEDAVHDFLILSWWNNDVKKYVYNEVRPWLEEIHETSRAAGLDSQMATDAAQTNGHA